MSTTETVLTRRYGPVAVLSISNPPANVMSEATLSSLQAALSYALNDEDVRAIIVTGEGRFFCAGANIKELSALHQSGNAGSFSRMGQDFCDRGALTQAGDCSNQWQSRHGRRRRDRAGLPSAHRRGIDDFGQPRGKAGRHGWLGRIPATTAHRRPRTRS